MKNAGKFKENIFPQNSSTKVERSKCLEIPERIPGGPESSPMGHDNFTENPKP